MKMIRMAPLHITKPQRKWLEAEAKRTGNSLAAVMRGLIQDKVNAEDGK